MGGRGGVVLGRRGEINRLIIILKAIPLIIFVKECEIVASEM